MVLKEILIVVCFAILVSADVAPLIALGPATILKSREIPSIYSSSVLQAVANDGRGLSYSTLQTHNPVVPVLESKLVQPVIRYDVGSFNLPLSNIGLFVQNPPLASGLVPVQQIESISNPGGSPAISNTPVLSNGNVSNNDDSVTIEAN